MEGLYQFLREFWVIWLMAIFLGIVVWTLWPSRRRSKEMRDHADIPFREAEDETSRDAEKDR